MNENTNSKAKNAKYTRNTKLTPKEKAAKMRSAKENKEMAEYGDRGNSISSGKLANCGSKLSTSGKHNDPNWYFLDSEIANQAASFSIDGFNGVPLSTGAFVDNAFEKMSTTIDSIMTVELNPSPGVTSTIQRGINAAALATFSKLSSLNAKTTSYAPQDLTMLMLGIGEVVSIMEHIRRAFGVAFTYNQRNRTVPYNLLQMMGFNAQDFLDNFADYRLRFNSLVTTLNKIPFVSNIAYLYKCADLYQHVYTDTNSDMAQIIVMRPWSTWTIDETYNDQGTGLVTTMLPHYEASDPSTSTFDKWEKIVGDMLNALLTSATFNFIYSDILNLSTKEGTKLFYMDYLVEGYIVVPEYNENFLLQFHNSTVMSNPQIAKTATIQEQSVWTPLNDVLSSVNTNTIKYAPGFVAANKPVQTVDTIVDFITPNPSVEDRIEATRFTVPLVGDYSVTDTSRSTEFRVIANLPDHYVVTMRLLDIENGESATTNHIQNWYSVSDVTGDVAKLIMRVSQYDWAPFIYLYSGTTGKYTYTLSNDVNYYSSLPESWFSRVNDLAFQALFSLR